MSTFNDLADERNHLPVYYIETTVDDSLNVALTYLEREVMDCLSIGYELAGGISVIVNEHSQFCCMQALRLKEGVQLWTSATNL